MDFSRYQESLVNRAAQTVSHRAKPCTALIACAIYFAACNALADGRQQQIEQVYGADGRLQLLKLDSNGNGTVDTWSYMEGPRIKRIELDTDHDGTIDRWEYYTEDQQVEKVGMSRGRDGKVDAWGFYAGDGSLARLEVSTRRNEVVNRVEFYEEGSLVRAEEDSNADWTIDKWETFDSGRLTSVSLDTVSQGMPDRRLVYARDGTVKLELLKSEPRATEKPGR